MNKQISWKLAAFTILCTFVISFGAISLAKTMWTYLSMCNYTLGMYLTTNDYDVITSGGSTATTTGCNAYVKAELQRYINGRWKTYHSASDTGYMMAAVENNVAVDPGYTYREKTTHRALDANGNILEEYVNISANTVVSLPRP